MYISIHIYICIHIYTCIYIYIYIYICVCVYIYVSVCILKYRIILSCNGVYFEVSHFYLFFEPVLTSRKHQTLSFCPSTASGLQQSYVCRSAALLSNGCMARVAPLPLHRLPEPVRSPHHLASSPVANCSGGEYKLLEDLTIHSLCFFLSPCTAFIPFSLTVPDFSQGG